MSIRCSQLVKTYGSRKVLDLDQLEIPKGSFFGLIGPNGAGKTTLLHILAGLDLDFQGELTYGEGFSLPRGATLLHQQAYMLRGTVASNIAYPLALRGMSKAQRKTVVASQLERLELTHLAGQNSATLSGGERQRVALARALGFSPSLLLLDEPTASADPLSTVLMERIFREEQAGGTTLVLVTHNLAQANRLCGQIAFLKEGRCLEILMGAELLKTPKHPEVKAYITDQVL